MISIGKMLDGHDIAQQVRFERQIHKGAFLLLEGDTDQKRFDRFVDEQLCSMVNCFGRANLIEAVELLYDEGFPGALGVADADFDRITGSLKEHEGIVYSERHDLDLDWVTDELLDRYLSEVGDKSKCQSAGGVDGIKQRIYGSVRPLSIMRMLNDGGLIKYKLSSIRHDDICVNGDIDLALLVDAVCFSPKCTKREKTDLIKLIESHSSQEIDVDQLTNGHDFYAILGVLLRSEFGDRKTPQSWGREVAIHFRLAFGEPEMRVLKIYRDVTAWEDENKYRVLKKLN